jgi:hypothetical protein
VRRSKKDQKEEVVVDGADESSGRHWKTQEGYQASTFPLLIVILENFGRVWAGASNVDSDQVMGSGAPSELTHCRAAAGGCRD